MSATFLLSPQSYLPVIIEDTVLREIDKQEKKLENLNEQITYALINLLNRDGGKGDDRCKKWVQNRLLDTERELHTCADTAGNLRITRQEFEDETERCRPRHAIGVGNSGDPPSCAGNECYDGLRTLKIELLNFSLCHPHLCYRK
jgi:hypothetical protein